VKHLYQRFSWCGATILMLCLAACTSRSPDHRGDKTREAVAKATERMKPEIRWSAQKLGHAAEWAAEEALAAIEGFFEGWNRVDGRGVDLNSANEHQLETLPEITGDDARKIVEGRPYRSTSELLTRGIVSDAAYRKIRDHVKVSSSGNRNTQAATKPNARH
jgi:hypothetical protein